jgi:hypothetical protein
MEPSMREIFNQSDIDANRQGKLSTAQVESIKAAVNPRVWMWGTVICLVLVGVVFLLSDGFAGALGFVGWIMGLVLLFCLVRWGMIWNLRRKLLNDPVTAADGDVTFKKLDVADRLRYSAETRDGARLYPQGLAGLSAALPPGDYRFYYLPTRRWLLSSEPLSSEAELKANLLEALDGTLGFDPKDLTSLRAQAAAGEVVTVEGQPKIDSLTSGTSEEPYVQYYVEIGGVRFNISPDASSAFIEKLRYRLYFYETEPANLLQKVINLGDNRLVAGIEPL